ncbi:hypothetical protein P3T39_001895 [Kitasatospora sp. GP82]|nr:hypothetical protein [Kitasatospora sp. GP82]
MSVAVHPPPRTSLVTRMTQGPRRDAVAAVDDLAGALALAGITLPSVAVDWQTASFSSPILVDLGRARPDVVEQLAEVIRRGALAERPASDGC